MANMTAPSILHTAEFARHSIGREDGPTLGTALSDMKVVGSIPMLRASPDRDTESSSEGDGLQVHSPNSSASSWPVLEPGTPGTPEYSPEHLVGAPSQAGRSVAPPQRIVAVQCEYVGGGLDGCMDLCSGVCIVDASGHVLLDTTVKPSIPITDFRYEQTGLTAAAVSKGMPFRKARRVVLSILKGGAKTESSSPVRDLNGASFDTLIVGANLQHALGCLMLEYPSHLLRDLAGPESLPSPSTKSHTTSLQSCSVKMEQACSARMDKALSLLRCFLES